MIIATPKEIKIQEYRVGITPACARAYVAAGHHVYLEALAGEGAGFSDQDYIDAGAHICATAAEIFAIGDMIIKVKEPQACEIEMFRPGQILFTYLHLASNKDMTTALMEKGVTAIAYEMIRSPDGAYPCLSPMSEIAGKLSIQQAAHCLEKSSGGRGLLLGGAIGVERAKIAVIGGGFVGKNAVQVAIGMGAEVTILDVNVQTLGWFDQQYGTRIHTRLSNEANISVILKESDAIIGAVLLPGKKPPHLIKRAQLKLMKKGSVLVDVAVDQGGCFESTRATSYDDPTFIEEGVVHSCIANLPGAVSRTSTLALTQQTLPYGKLIAAATDIKDLLKLEAIAAAISIHDYHLTSLEAAESLGFSYTELSQA